MICVEKNSELPEGDPLRKFKGRLVFLGDQAKDPNWESAIFQEMASAPATMEAARIADAYGCAPGHTIEAADAEQAYIQAFLKGPVTWVEIPRMFWPQEWVDGGHRRPVVRLLRALYSENGGSQQKLEFGLWRRGGSGNLKT